LQFATVRDSHSFIIVGMFKFVFLALLARPILSEDAAVSTLLQSIEDGVSKVELPGSQKKIAISSLMRQMAGANAKLTPDQTETMQNVSTLLEDVRGILATAGVDETALANAYVATLDDCNVYDQASIDTETSNVNALETAHTTARTTEVTDHAQYTTDCDAWVSFVTNLASHTCYPTSAIQDIVDQWTSSAIATYNFFQTALTSFNTHRSACDASEATWQTSASAADDAQGDYEEALCTLRTLWDATCTQRATCYSDNSDPGQYTTWEDQGADRRRIARMIDYVQCLITEMLAGNAATAITNPTCQAILNNDVSGSGGYSSYGPTLPTPPTQAACGIPGSLPTMPTGLTQAYTAAGWTGATVLSAETCAY
jgi:hypothetical protein